MRRAVLFSTAVVIAGLIINASLWYREQTSKGAASPLALVTVEVTPSPVSTGLLNQPQTVPYLGTETAVIPHDFFLLTGAHATLTCAACHSNGVYTDLGSMCIDCHAGDDIHRGRNGPDCALCHIPTRWSDATFDHSTIGQLDCVECHQPPISHYPGACVTCHLDTTSFLNVRFDHAVIGNMDCGSCHSPPPNHFPGACSICHLDTNRFSNTSFSHGFPLNHGEANAQCGACHLNNNTAIYTCAGCHNQDEMIEEHADKDIFEINNCVECHVDGQKPEDD